MRDYRGYSAKIAVDEELGMLHGTVLGITDVVTFQAKTVDELEPAFHESVDDYLAWCEERGEKPDKPYSGRFVLRVKPELHRRASIAAKLADMSLNEWIVSVVESALREESKPPTLASVCSWAGLGRLIAHPRSPARQRFAPAESSRTKGEGVYRFFIRAPEGEVVEVRPVGQIASENVETVPRDEPAAVDN
jgi:predicted HicB family RNase H-like nuclease